MKTLLISHRLKLIALFSFFIVLPFFMFGQTTGIEDTLTDVKDWIVAIANILFVIAIVFGIIRTVAAFIQGSPNAPRYLLFLIIAALVFFGFSVLISDFSGLGDIGNI